MIFPCPILLCVETACFLEIDSLFEIIAKLKAQGKIIIYVSHRMKEIQQIADKVAIFKDSHYVDTVVTKEVPEQPEMICICKTKM